MDKTKEVLLVGAGYMAAEYAKVLKAQNTPVIALCRKDISAQDFKNKTGIETLSGGVEALDSIDSIPKYAIVAVSAEHLSKVTVELIDRGIKYILVEKPAGLNKQEIEEICVAARTNLATVYVAYNRRFYASVDKATEIIEEDGGLLSFNFEFTEWSDTIEKSDNIIETKEEWLLANSSHVIDLAFFFGGEPEVMTSYQTGGLSWHKRASIYSGAGVTKKGCLFSYQANWEAPGRWGVELLTRKHRLYLRPMEKLSIQNINSVVIEDAEIDDSLDRDYKPGLYNQVVAFLNNDDSRLLPIYKQFEHLSIYREIEKSTDD